MVFNTAQFIEDVSVRMVELFATVVDSQGRPIRSTEVVFLAVEGANVDQQVADAIAKQARQLAYYHMVPAPVNALAERMFLRDLPADIILVRDLQTFDLPPDSTEIRIREP